MRFLNYLPLPFLFLFAGCSLDQTDNLLGSWTAVSVFQNDRAMDVNHSEITLSFTEKGTYNYTSTLEYKEAGYFRLDGKTLETTDTLAKPHASKLVLVEQLKSDTLQLKMKNEADWMLLTMVKK